MKVVPRVTTTNWKADGKRRVGQTTGSISQGAERLCLQLNRQGVNVIVLKQDPSKDRLSHESGVSIGPTAVKLLEKNMTPLVDQPPSQLGSSAQHGCNGFALRA
ncbi:hypothetical protein N7527_001892 [Penicillium freii]|nr:hypothetical protein N7527_001892 [Penicillium freii]